MLKAEGPREWPLPALDLLRERHRAIPAPWYRSETRRRSDRGASLDCRDRKIEFGAGAFPGQRNADRMKERLALMAGALPHTIRHRAKRLPIGQRSVNRERQRRNHFAGPALVQHAGNLIARQRGRRIELEEELQSIGDLLEPI